VAAALPLPAGLPLDATSWEQTPLVVRQAVVQLLAVIQPQQARIAALDARVSQNSRHSDRPPSSDPPFVTPSSSAPTKGTPGAKPGYPGHRQALLEPTEVIEVTPDACACGQQEFPTTTP
jgi:transposase